MKDRELVLLTPSQGPSLPQKDNSMSINYLDLQNNPTGLNQLRHRPSQVQESNKSHSARVPEHRFLALKAHVFPLNQATLHNPWICLATQKAELHPAVVYGHAEQTTIKYTEENVLINLLHFHS